jgi:hypothetical protein
MKHPRSLFAALALLCLGLADPACQEDTPIGSNGLSSTGGTAGTSSLGGGGGVSSQPSPTLIDGGAVACAQVEADIYAGCPAQPAGDGTACPVLRQVCDYQRDNGWSSCVCVAGSKGNTWSCYGLSAGYDCPLARPAHGAACGRDDWGRSCHYVRSLACTCDGDRERPHQRDIRCDCKKEAETWACANQGVAGATGTSADVPFDEAVCYRVPPPRPQPPIDESKAIKDLSDAEATAYCEWYVDLFRGDGPPPPRNPPRGFDAQGNALGYGFTSCEGGPLTGCLSTVPVDICVKSLRRKPCAATLRDLDDCVLSFRDDCNIVGGGCRAMAATPECSATLVRLDAPPRPSQSDCAVATR